MASNAAPFSGLVAQWITRLPTEQKIPGSSPGKIAYFFYFYVPGYEIAHFDVIVHC